MSGGLGRAFRDDPFFRDDFFAHHEDMRRMMRGFADPFGQDPFLSITGDGERTADRRVHQDSQVALRRNHRAPSFFLMPFAGFGRMVRIPGALILVALAGVGCGEDFEGPFFAVDRMMSNMRNTMLEMQRKFDDLSIHPDAHTFRSSSVVTYSKVGDEPPKVFQASAQTRTAPGGIKETRKALKDSESGLEKMAIGHHIHDRAHVIKKSRNNKTGDEELNQEFINLEEAEAQTFEEEWQEEIMKFKPSRAGCHWEAPKYQRIHHVPKEGGLRREKPRALAASRQPRTSAETLNVKGTHVPIKSSKK